MEETFADCEPCSREQEWTEIGRGAFAGVYLASPNVIVKKYTTGTDGDDGAEAYLPGAYTSYLMLREVISIRTLCQQAARADHESPCPPLYSVRASDSTVELKMMRGACLHSEATIQSLAAALIEPPPANGYDGHANVTGGVLAELAVDSWRALSTTHTAGIMHRDIKPPNMVLGATWTACDSAPAIHRPLRVMLIDWNSSRVFLTRRVFSAHDRRENDAEENDGGDDVPQPRARSPELLTPEIYTVYTRPPEVCSMTRRKRSAIGQATYDSKADVWSMAMTLLITLSKVHEAVHKVMHKASSPLGPEPKRRRKATTAATTTTATTTTATTVSFVYDAFNKAFVDRVKPSDDVPKENVVMLRVLHQELCGPGMRGAKRLGSRWFKRTYGLRRVPASYATILESIDLGLVFDPEERASAGQILHAISCRHPETSERAPCLPKPANPAKPLTDKQLQSIATNKAFLAGVRARRPELSNACAFAEAFAETVCVRELHMSRLPQPVCAGLLCLSMLIFSNSIPSVEDMEEICNTRFTALACMQSREAVRQILAEGCVFSLVPDILARLSHKATAVTTHIPRPAQDTLGP